jgi:hypothetical protein
MKLPADSTPTSDHIPCVVSVGISISKLKIFRFEYSITIQGFIDVVKTIWKINCRWAMENVDSKNGAVAFL